MMSLTLTNIPRIMRSHGWVKGATLMDRWFRGFGAVAPRYGKPDDSTITMSWILGFSRAKQVYDTLITDRIWQNPAAQKEIARMLRRKGMFAMSGTRPFGQLGDPVPTQHADYVNFRPFTDGGYYGSYYGAYYGYSSDVMDDLTAALGRFTFHTVVGGEVTSSPFGKGPPSFTVSIDEVGVYVRDSYDFNGDQPLGFWDDSDNSVSAINFFSGDYVNNESFRDWRTANRRGGDFEIFTDMSRFSLATPFIFTAS